MRRFRKILIAAAVLGLATPVSRAFTASPGPDPGGTGGATVGGYQISNIHYHPSTDDPTRLAAVTIDPRSPTTIKIRLTANRTFHECSNTAGTVTCFTGDSDLPLDAISELR